MQENKRKPEILIQTDGITKTKVIIDGKELESVTGVRFSQSYKENSGLPILQIDMKATNVTLDAKMLPALPEPFSHHFVPVNKIMALENLSDDDKEAIRRELGIG